MFFSVKLTNGETLVSDSTSAQELIEVHGSAAEARSVLEGLIDALEHIADAGYLKITTGGDTIYINPKHVLYVSLLGMEELVRELGVE